MERVDDFDYEVENGQVIITITTPTETYRIIGFEDLLKEHLWKILDSEFEDSELFFRDQPYQKLVMSKQQGFVRLDLTYPERDPDDVSMKADKERFKRFLENLKMDLEE